MQSFGMQWAEENGRKIGTLVETEEYGALEWIIADTITKKCYAAGSTFFNPRLIPSAKRTYGWNTALYVRKDGRWQKATSEDHQKLIEKHEKMNTSNAEIKTRNDEIKINKTKQDIRQKNLIKLIDVLELDLTNPYCDKLDPSESYLLIEYLKNQSWQLADDITYKIFLQVCRHNLSTSKGLHLLELVSIPVAIFKEVDKLWLKYSKGHFGFSVQSEILKDFTFLDIHGEFAIDLLGFGTKVGWYNQGKWCNYGEQNFSLNAPRGHLPLQLPVPYEGAAWDVLSLCCTYEFFGYPALPPKYAKFVLEILNLESIDLYVLKTSKELDDLKSKLEDIVKKHGIESTVEYLKHLADIKYLSSK